MCRQERVPGRENSTDPRVRALHCYLKLLSNSDSVLKVSAMETPTRSEPVAQEDKTKLLKTAFLQFCRCVNKQLPNPLKVRLWLHNMKTCLYRYCDMILD